MALYLVRRLLGLLPTLLIVAVLVFLFVHLLPGDPARLAAGVDAGPETVELVRRDLGLDRPLPEQFVRFFGHALSGDFGKSIRSQRPVATEIAERFGPTFWLTVAAMGWSVVLGMLLGIVSAVWRNRWPDRVGMTLAVSGISFPSFALGMVLMQLFSVQLGWLPTVGADSWRHYILPSLTLGAGVAAVMARFTRSSFIDILKEDYVRTARAKGVSENRIMWVHVLRNASIPIITHVMAQLPGLLIGAFLVERFFSIPGIGREVILAVERSDFPVIKAITVYVAVATMIVNLLTDLMYKAVDPRVQLK